MGKLNDDSSSSNNEDVEDGNGQRINQKKSDCCDNNFETSEEYKNALAKRLAEILERFVVINNSVPIEFTIILSSNKFFYLQKD